MRKSNLSEKLGKIIKAGRPVVAIVAVIAALIVTVDTIIGSCNYDPFLSYGGVMLCCSIMCAGAIYGTLVNLYLLIVDIRRTLLSDDEASVEAVASDHGDDLTTVMEAIRNEPLEYRAMFDINERKLTEGTLNSPERCNVPTKEWRKVYNDIHIDLHNHPGFPQTSFSDADYRSMIQTRARYMIVVTKSFNYIMENPRCNHKGGPTAEEVGNYAQRLLCEHIVALVLFPCRYSQYVSRRVAQKFGFIYHIEDLRRNALGRRSRITPRRIVAASLLTGAIAVTSLMCGSTLATGVSGSNSDAAVCELTVDGNAGQGYSCATELAESSIDKPSSYDYYVDDLRRQLCQAKDGSEREMIAKQSDFSSGVYQLEKPELVDFID